MTKKTGIKFFVLKSINLRKFFFLNSKRLPKTQAWEMKDGSYLKQNPFYIEN